MPITWQFVESYVDHRSRWSWRLLRADGTVQDQSPPFDSYGLVVCDAIKHGFLPRQHDWIVADRHTITHFRSGQSSWPGSLASGQSADPGFDSREAS